MNKLPSFSAAQVVAASGGGHYQQHYDATNTRGLNKCKRGKERCCQRGIGGNWCCVPKEIKCRHAKNSDCTRHCFH